MSLDGSQKYKTAPKPVDTEKNKLLSRLDDLEHAASEMLRYIKQGISVYRVSPPMLMKKWNKLIDDDINTPCYYENTYYQTMDLLKELNPDVYYQVLDERDKRRRK